MIELKAGDFFCTKNRSAIGRAIVTVEKARAKDDHAKYSHAGIITDSLGTTLEALEIVKGGSLDDYAEKEMIIGRWRRMNSEVFQKGIDAIADNIHQTYPWWRIVLMALGFGKAKTGNHAVCSELVCKFLMGAGFPGIGTWRGQNPDDIADMIVKWKTIDVVFEGEWKKV